MAKNIKRYKQYTEESDDFVRKRKLKKESRHNYKVELEQSIDDELWDEVDVDEASDNNR